ncbi:hypothetical protein IWQ60_007629 [Tieghemiomyces parasiticus]|uniref:Carbohydrate kinase PfkB domain-containing protein n=1 Tax=Tieghemiomyces parasiticus TaxID=78921 RepID=A0A9W7ZX25_9FUNG|nr:hypothetical protein IWQ60_007629 [Tieghemiomyces parasiticus]
MAHHDPGLVPKDILIVDHPVTLLQILGGATGTYIDKALRQKGIHHINVEVQAETRTCTTVLDASTGSMTELIEPTSRITAEERTAFEDRAQSLITTGAGKLRIIALCGSFPNGMDSETFAKIAHQKPDSAFLYLDAVKDIELILSTRKVDMIKINLEEFVKIIRQLGFAGQSGNFFNAIPDLESDESSQREFAVLAKRLMETYHVGLVAITNGPYRAFLFQRGGTGYHTFRIPDLVGILQRMYLANVDLFVEKHTENCLPPTVTLKHRQKMLEWEAENEECLNRIRRRRRLGRGGISPDPVPGVLDREVTDTVDQTDPLIRTKPPIELLLNPLGAGDTTNGVFICEYLRSQDPVRSFAMGLAAATASCLVTDFTGYYDVKIMHAVFSDIAVESHVLD